MATEPCDEEAMRNIGCIALVVLAVAAGNLPAHATQPRGRPCVDRSGALARVVPRDEANQRADFAEFREELRQAVARRDENAIMAIVHPDIKAGFDGSDGRDAFKEKYLQNPEEDFWKEFGVVLSMGGRFAGANDFTAPYTFTDFPNDLDAFECMVVTGRDVLLRAVPRSTAPIVARLDHHVVQVFFDDTANGPWRRVETADRRVGYIASRYLRSPIDYRASFRFENGRWWLVMYLAGD